MQVAKPKYVARAPRGSEVEELDPYQIKAALEAKVPFEEAFAALQSRTRATSSGRGTPAGNRS